MPTIVVNQDTCTRCGACVRVCRASRVFELRETAAEVVRAEECWLCGHCVAVCPVDAIRHSDYPLEQCPTIESLPAYEELVGALRGRRSLRVFEDEPVPRETVRELIDVSRWAPSASNRQPVDWIAVDDPARIARLSAEVAATLGRLVPLLRNRFLRPFLYLLLGRENAREAVGAADDFERLARERAQGQDPIFYHAPVVLVAHVPRGAYFGREDATYAAYNLMLAAERLEPPGGQLQKLGTCHIGYFNAALERSQKLERILGLPQGRRVEVVMALGYRDVEFHRALPRRRPDLLWNPGPR